MANAGETERIEWKSSWRDDLLAYVCGFANAQGGTLIVGRADNVVVVGVPDAPRLLEDLPNRIRDLLGAIAQVELVRENGKDQIQIVTPAYPNPISYRGHYYQRSGSTLQQLKGPALDQFLLRRYGRTWDGSPLPGASPTDLAPTAFKLFRALAERSGRIDLDTLNANDTDLLQRLKLTEGDHLKRAAVLLFHPDPTRYVTGAFVKIGYFDTSSELRYHDLIAGDLFAQAKRTEEILLLKYLKASIHGGTWAA